MPAVFAAGDVRHGSTKRVAAAVGEGASAVQAAHRHFQQLADRSREIAMNAARSSAAASHAGGRDGDDQAFHGLGDHISDITVAELAQAHEG